MALKYLGVKSAHPSPNPDVGDYNLYVLSTDDHYYLQDNTQELDLTEGVSDHADLSGLQGGTVGEYYHMTSTENTEATQIASGSQDGLLSSTDWTTFNNKQDALSTGDLTEATSSILTILGGTGAVIGSGASIEVQVANTSQAGYLTSTDWNTLQTRQISMVGQHTGTGSHRGCV